MRKAKLLGVGGGSTRVIIFLVVRVSITIIKSSASATSNYQSLSIGMLRTTLHSLPLLLHPCPRWTSWLKWEHLYIWEDTVNVALKTRIDTNETYHQVPSPKKEKFHPGLLTKICPVHTQEHPAVHCCRAPRWPHYPEVREWLRYKKDAFFEGPGASQLFRK